MKRYLTAFLIVASILTGFTGISEAKCVSHAVKESQVVGYKTITHKDGTTEEVPLYAKVTVGYTNTCTDVINGTMYYTRDLQGNIYDISGNKIGTNNQVSGKIDVDVLSHLNNDITDPSRKIDMSQIKDIKFTQFSDSIKNEKDFLQAYGWKTNSSNHYQDYMKNIYEKGVKTTSVTNVNIGADGKVSATISGNASSGSGLNLSMYTENKAGLERYLGAMPKSLSGQLDAMKADASIKRELVMIPYSIEVTREYEYRETKSKEKGSKEHDSNPLSDSYAFERIPDAPINPAKPNPFTILDDVKGCPSYYTWTEVDYDEVHSKDTYFTDSNGKDYTYDKITWKPHKYNYRVDFTTSVTITDAKGNNIQTKPMKSGYGYKVSTNTTYKFSGDEKIRPHKTDLNIQAPKFAYEQHDFNMTHIYKTQPKKNLLKGNGAWKFKTPANPLSKTKSDVIYTDRDMKDGTHNVYVEVTGISVAGRSLCTKNIEKIKIKGNMYEDYKVN